MVRGWPARLEMNQSDEARLALATGVNIVQTKLSMPGREDVGPAFGRNPHGLHLDGVSESLMNDSSEPALKP
jgi:hypothetical protein